MVYETGTPATQYAGKQASHCGADASDAASESGEGAQQQQADFDPFTAQQWMATLYFSVQDVERMLQCEAGRELLKEATAPKHLDQSNFSYQAVGISFEDTGENIALSTFVSICQTSSADLPAIEDESMNVDWDQYMLCIVQNEQYKQWTQLRQEKRSQPHKSAGREKRPYKGLSVRCKRRRRAEDVKHVQQTFLKVTGDERSSEHVKADLRKNSERLFGDEAKQHSRGVGFHFVSFFFLFSFPSLGCNAWSQSD